jgi:cytochrome c oxidase subunit IV
VVFAALAALTILTVAVSYLDVSPGMHISLALIIAVVKGALVAMFFMHLIDERKAVYWILILTAIFFVVLMFVPFGSVSNSTGIG